MHMEQENQTKQALLVIDVQQGLFEKSHPIYKATELLDNINSLVGQAHRAGVPVFYINIRTKGISSWAPPVGSCIPG
jgi:nicotinamidase-related amidase